MRHTFDPETGGEVTSAADRMLKLLIVEDNPGDARLLEEMLAGDVPFDLKWVERLSETIQVLDEGGG